jgi:hypothetical protein
LNCEAGDFLDVLLCDCVSFTPSKSLSPEPHLFEQTFLDRDQIEPQLMQGCVPLCMSQYTRTFCTTRIPGVEEGVFLGCIHRDLKCLFMEKHDDFF